MSSGIQLKYDTFGRFSVRDVTNGIFRIILLDRFKCVPKSGTEWKGNITKPMFSSLTPDEQQDVVLESKMFRNFMYVNKENWEMSSTAKFIYPNCFKI